MLEMITKTISLASALLTGKDVSERRMQKRVEICSTCPNVKPFGEGDMAIYQCGVCGCHLSGDSTLVNLARYEEQRLYGCKAVGGSKWKAYRSKEFPDGV